MEDAPIIPGRCQEDKKSHSRLTKLRDILGHANIATTDRYSHANARRMQEMVEEL